MQASQRFSYSSQSTNLVVGTLLTSLVAFVAIGCAALATPVGMAGGSVVERALTRDKHYFQTGDTIMIASPAADIFATIQSVADSIEYRVSSVDRNLGTVSMSSKDATSTIGVQVVGGGTRLNVTILVFGAGRAGEQERANAVFLNFKTHLLRALNITSDGAR